MYIRFGENLGQIGHNNEIILLPIQTGQNVPRELIKRWNVTNSSGIAPINIFKAINADSTIMCASFAVKPTATRLKRVSLLDGSSFSFFQRYNHQLFHPFGISTVAFRLLQQAPPLANMAGWI